MLLILVVSSVSAQDKMVRIGLRSNEGKRITDQSMLEIKSDTGWYPLETTLDTALDHDYFFCEVKDSIVKYQMRWRHKEDTLWKTDFVYLNRFKQQDFYDLKQDYAWKYNMLGKNPLDYSNKIKIYVYDPYFGDTEWKEQDDSIVEVLRHKNIGVKSIDHGIVELENMNDRNRLGFVRDHFNYVNLSPKLKDDISERSGKKVSEKELNMTVNVYFQPGVSRSQALAIIAQSGVDSEKMDFYTSSDDLGEYLYATLYLWDLLSDQAYQSLDSLYYSNEVSSLFTNVNTMYID